MELHPPVVWPFSIEFLPYHGWVGVIPYQALHLLQFFLCVIFSWTKFKKGEGEPGNEANAVYN